MFITPPYYLAQFDHLGDDGFTVFLNLILKEIFGPSLIPFGKGIDGGRDATFDGIPKKYEKIQGYWVFQYKFHELTRVGNTKARSVTKKDFTEEIEKILNRPKKPDCYILITNAELFSSKFGDWFDEIKNKYDSKFDHLDIWDSKRISLWLYDPDLSKYHEQIPTMTINLYVVGDLIIKELVKERYPNHALTKIKSGISSHNFEWFKNTITKYWKVLPSDETKNELLEITLIWLKKYPDRSTEILETLDLLFENIDISTINEKFEISKFNCLGTLAEMLKELVGLFSERNDNKALRKINQFIISKFDLISEDSRHFTITPKDIYSVIKLINSNLNEALNFSSEITDQFSSRYGRIYKGFELMGGGYGQSGSEVTLSELAIVDEFLSPVILSNYKINPIDTWDVIENQILSKRISKSNPAWVIRSCIRTILDSVLSHNTSNVAIQHIIELIKIKKGLPSFSESIFNIIRNDIERYPQNVIIKFIRSELEDNGIPSNIFLIMVIFELINLGNKAAESILLNLLSNNMYLKQDVFYYDTLSHFHIIKDRPELKLKIINKLLLNNSWVSV